MLLFRLSMGTYPENELTRNLTRSIRPHASQLAEPRWTDPGIKSGNCVRELISTHTQKKKKEKKRKEEKRKHMGK